MDTLVREIEKVPLSGEDLIMMTQKLGNPQATWMLYDDLVKFEFIDQLFVLDRKTGEHKFNTVFILLQILNNGPEAQVGHWISLSFDDKLEIQYYDPYGLTIEQDLVVTGERDHLTRLLGNHNINVNRFQHQSFRHEVNVCGRHIVIRGLFHFMSNNQYNEQVVTPLIKSKEVQNADVFVSLITVFLSKSDEVIRQFFKKKVGMNLNIFGRSDLSNRNQGVIPIRGKGLGGGVVG